MFEWGECINVVFNNCNVNCKALLFVEQTANMHSKVLYNIYSSRMVNLN